MRIPAGLATFLLLLLSTAYALAAPAPICNALSETQVRVLTGVASGAFSQHPYRISDTDARCIYGVTDGDLVLDVYNLDSDATAIAKMARLGGITNSDNYTASPYGTDQVNLLRAGMQDSMQRPMYLTGFAARHGSTIVVLALDRPDSDFSPAGKKRLQGAALELAGARLLPWPTFDVCAHAPPATVQTLVALGPARLIGTTKHSAGGNSDCTYVFHPLNGEDDAKVVLKSERWINDLEALAHDQSTRVALPFTTSDSADTALSVREPDYQAAALHTGQLGRVEVFSSSKAAEQDDSWRTHLAQAAMLAAGGTITGGAALQGIPPAVAPNALNSAQAGLENVVTHYWFLLVVGLVIAYFIWRGHRRKQLLVNGMNGTATVNSISDTGITINNSPRIKLHMTITPDHGEPYNATQGLTVSRLEAPSNWIGRQVAVKIDRNDHARFVIVP